MIEARGSISGRGKARFSSAKHADRALGPTNGYQKAFSQGKVGEA